MTQFTNQNEEDDAPDHVPAGTAGTGRKARAEGTERRNTVKQKKSRNGSRKVTNRKKKNKTTKPVGKNVTYAVTEAARILKTWGYRVGKVDDPDLPFDLMASKGNGVIYIRVIRPREPVMNAAGVRAYYSGEVVTLQPFWNSDADNIQFWLISRVAGLLRYRVFRGGIWNVETMQNGHTKTRAEAADCKTEGGNPAVQESRTARGRAASTGCKSAPD